MTVKTKICGLKTPEAVLAAVKGGAAYVGFVFFAASPRNISPEHVAELTPLVPAGVTRVALTVDADDDLIASIVSTAGIDMIQLHGKESPERVQEIKQRFCLPVMKVIPVSTAADLAAAADYENVADQLLFDARPPKGATRPGGNAVSFDWKLMHQLETSLPWVLAGGLSLENVAEAISVSGATAVDVSSAVETAPGVKDIKKIKAFIEAVSAA